MYMESKGWLLLSIAMFVASLMVIDDAVLSAKWFLASFVAAATCQIMAKLEEKE